MTAKFRFMIIMMFVLFLFQFIMSKVQLHLKIHDTHLFDLIPSKAYVNDEHERQNLKITNSPRNSSRFQSNSSGSLIINQFPTNATDSNILDVILNTMPQGDILMSYGNRDYLPFHLHWICNTAGWPDVQARSLLAIGDEFSRAAIKRISKNKVKTFLVEESSHTHGFYSKGYRKLTIRRVTVLVQILRSGRGVIMFEGDALWTRNILEDDNLAGNNRTHDVAFYQDGGGIGAGSFLTQVFRLYSSQLLMNNLGQIRI